nr:4785_t:CDS:2 [Entrophospora candida]
MYDAEPLEPLHHATKTIFGMLPKLANMTQHNYKRNQELLEDVRKLLQSSKAFYGTISVYPQYGIHGKGPTD